MIYWNNESERFAIQSIDKIELRIIFKPKSLKMNEVEEVEELEVWKVIEGYEISNFGGLIKVDSDYNLIL